ncbi:agarase [Nitrobacter sp.]|uniref:agarase n=1 Tax=Nitrobacter sp. TaxID=29420 RepID=UPI0032207B1D
MTGIKAPGSSPARIVAAIHSRHGMAMVRSRWGGIPRGNAPAGKFFRTETISGVWWLIDPDGGRFLSKGVNTVRYDQDAVQNSDRIPYAEACRRKYGSEDAWRAAAAARLLSWGFNTLGSWSDMRVANAGPSPLAATPTLHLGSAFASRSSNAAPQAFPDVFDPAFERHVAQRAHDLCAPWCEDQHIIGWFSDNELRWGPDWRGDDALLTLFLNLPPQSPGRRASLELLRERYGSFADFNTVWRSSLGGWDELAASPHIAPPCPQQPTCKRDATTDAQISSSDPEHAAFLADCDLFAGRIAHRYFSTVSAAVRKADPNHLFLGCRFAYAPSSSVIDAAKPHLDILSFNNYDPDVATVIDSYAATGKPCMVTEFSFRGDDSGLPNTIGAGLRVPRQTDRARCFRSFVESGLSHPNLVGYHWFEHADQPAEGRFDGENSNYGTVTIEDVAYEELTRTMADVNARAETIHAGAAAPGWAAK